MINERRKLTLRLSDDQYEALARKRLNYIKETGVVVTMNEFLIITLGLKE